MPFDRHVGHVADDDGDAVATRLCTELFDHLGRRLDAFDGDATKRERQPHPAGSDGELEHPPVTGEAGEELDRGGRIGLRALVVVVGPQVTEECGIVESRHVSRSIARLEARTTTRWSRCSRRRGGSGGDPAPVRFCGVEPEKAGQTLKKSARIGLTGTLIGIYTIADATTVGLLIVIVSAWTHAPLILFAVAAVLLTIVNLGCCRWIQRRWDEWIGSGIARRIEARLEKMRRGILKHPVAWIERGSDGWFTLAAGSSTRSSS